MGPLPIRAREEVEAETRVAQKPFILLNEKRATNTSLSKGGPSRGKQGAAKS